MKAGIIAAGEGRRFREQGWSMLKPLVPIHGTPLIEIAFRAMESAGIEEIFCLFRTQGQPIVDHLKKCPFKLRWSYQLKDTASSYETFYHVVRGLGSGPYLISTVDLVYDSAELKAFLARASHFPKGSLVLGVTSFVHDEKPLWVALGPDQKVLKLGDQAVPTPWVTAGLYFGSEKAFAPLVDGGPHRFSALREGLSMLVTQGVPTYTVSLSTVIDIDTPEDVEIAKKIFAPHPNPLPKGEREQG
ncbi:MAG: NDP-sugar synthase [Deltaproteobacteria bacterium]|nr:NDP-sugar synthase [Deltaproteobacteria bacterium]